MGSVKVDLLKKGIRLDETYRLSSPDAVRRLIDDWAHVAIEASKGNYDAVDLLVDFAAALDEAFLNDDELDVIRYRRANDFSIEEIAGIFDRSEWAIEAILTTACEKVSRYFEGTEGYGGHREISP